MMAKKLLWRFLSFVAKFYWFFIIKSNWICVDAVYFEVFCKQHLLFIYALSVNLQVQHPHMTETAAADQATVELIVNTLHNFFPSFDYRYCYDAIHC
jgi:hypothetical protein